MQEKKFESRKQEYLYQLLDRLRTDCEYYLGNGNHHPQALWAGNEQGQIDKMREIWNQLEEKPEWLTWEDINEYAAKMGVEDLPSTKDGTAEKEIQDMLDRNYEKEKKVGLEEADISTNSTSENLEKEKEEVEQQLKDVEELQAKKKELDDKVDELFEEGKEIKSNNRLLTFKLYDSGYREYNGGQISSDKEIITINDLKRNINYNWKKLNSNSNKEKVTILKNELIENIKALINTIEIKIANIEKSRDTGSPKDREVIENRLYSLDIAKDNCLEALEKITNKINVKQEESKEIKTEDQYELERRRGIPPLDRIAEMEYYDNEKWYKEHIKDYLDITDFVNKNIAEISSEYNLKDTKAEEVCKKVYKLALGLDKKEESQVSNYTLEEIGQCLKDKGNDFKLQITGADSKTKWLNIDKDDVQKIYNTLSYKKKKTESLDTTVDLFEQANDLYNSNAISAWQLFLIGQMVEYIDYNIENSNITIDDLVRLSEEFNIEDSDILSTINNFILENIASKFDKLDESIYDNLDLEPGSDEETKLNELTDRNLKAEFDALSEEEKQKYLDCIPENGNHMNSDLVKKFAKKYDLDHDLLYWVINIKDKKVEERKDPEEGFEINEDLAWECDSILYKNILTTYIEDTNTLLFTKYKGEDASYNDSDDIDTIVYRNQTPEEIKKYIDTNLISNKLNESIDNIIKEEQEEINKINDEIESLKHLQQAYRGENENYVQELQDEIDALLADKEILEQELEEDKKQLIEAKDANKFPSSDGTKMKLSNYDFEEAYKTVANFRDLFNKEQKEWLIAHHISMNELYNGLKDLLSTFKVSIFKDIISIDDYIKELNKTESLNESTSTDLYNKIKNEPKSDKYEKGLKLRDEIVNAWKNNDLETADNKWEELYMLFSSPIEDLDSSVTEEQTLRNNIELNEILSTIEDQCVYDVTDYGREKDYKKMGF